jgi:signal peptidase I
MKWQFWKKAKPTMLNRNPRSVNGGTQSSLPLSLLLDQVVNHGSVYDSDPSMENSLLVGDFLFVSKFHYGTRTTTTPLQVPLTHQKIWFTNIPSYLEWIKLPQYRLPGISM